MTEMLIERRILNKIRSETRVTGPYVPDSAVKTSRPESKSLPDILEKKITLNLTFEGYLCVKWEG